MGDILVGTASWADKSLISSKLFYPKGTSTAEARLRHYATYFPRSTRRLARGVRLGACLLMGFGG